MDVAIQPVPVPGNFVVRPTGICEIESAFLSTMDNHWDIYLVPVDSQCEDGDTILVLNKDRMYKCHKNTYEYGFKKVTLYTLMTAVDELNQKVTDLKTKLENVDIHHI